MRWFVLTLVTLSLTGAVWQTYLRPRFVPKRWKTVYAGQVYRSGQLSRALVRRVLVDHGIRVVVDLTIRDLNDRDQSAEVALCKSLGIEHVRYPLLGDGTGDPRNYASAISRIHAAVRSAVPVLVHCGAGVQRTGGVIAAYQLLVRRMPPERVYRTLTQRTAAGYPVNPVVVAYLNDHMQEIADLLVRQGTLQRVPSPLPLLH